MQIATISQISQLRKNRINSVLSTQNNTQISQSAFGIRYATKLRRIVIFLLVCPPIGFLCFFVVLLSENKYDDDASDSVTHHCSHWAVVSVKLTAKILSQLIVVVVNILQHSQRIFTNDTNSPTVVMILIFL